MSSRALAALALALAACGPDGDPLRIRYTFVTEGDKACPAATCDGIARTCGAVVMLRVVDADRPAQQPYRQCKRIGTFQDNLCPLNEVVFDAGTIPTGRVMVQMAIYQEDKLGVELGEPVCPAEVEFTANGFAKGPTENPIQPALSGRAFADGYDDEVVVELGCHDLEDLDSGACTGELELDVTATVIDFETQVSVSGGPTGVASRLLVDIGEPRQSDQEWVLETTALQPLAVDLEDPVPSWSAEGVSLRDQEGQARFTELVCVRVEEDLPSRVASLTCYDALQPLPPALELTGVLVRKPTLDAVLEALGLVEFPTACPDACGLVLGIVVDQTGRGVAGAIVRDDVAPTSSTVEYLSEDRTATSTSGSTASHGIFVVQNAPLFPGAITTPNSWTASPAPGAEGFVQVNEPVGGIVSNLLTVVVVRVQTTGASLAP